MAATLGKNGWDGNLAASIGLELSPDNLLVARQKARGQLIMRGKLCEESAVVQANKLWEAADKEAMVSITFPSAAEFDFAGGSLHSEYLTSEGVKLVASKGDRSILPTDWPAFGILNFCLRAIINPAKPSPYNGLHHPLFPPHARGDVGVVRPSTGSRLARHQTAGRRSPAFSTSAGGDMGLPNPAAHLPREPLCAEASAS